MTKQKQLCLWTVSRNYFDGFIFQVDDQELKPNVASLREQFQKYDKCQN